MRWLHTLCLALALIPSGVKAQSITGGELISACEQALAGDFSGMQGMACSWYVTPCDCINDNPEQPRVCLPQAIPENDLARMVIDGIRNRPELLGMDAAVAAGTILSETWPCQD